MSGQGPWEMAQWGHDNGLGFVAKDQLAMFAAHCMVDLRAELANTKRDKLITAQTALDKADAENADLRAKLAEAEKDRARLDWLEGQATDLPAQQGAERTVHASIMWLHRDHRFDIRQAIDAAMGQAGKGDSK